MYTGYPVKCSSVFGSDTRLLDSHIPLLCYSKTVIDIRFFLTHVKYVHELDHTSEICILSSLDLNTETAPSQ